MLRLWLFLAGSAAAIPFNNGLYAAGYGYLVQRDGCPVPCGYQNQYCCDTNSACVTNNGIAACTPAAGAGGGVAWYTTTWTETKTYTKTWQSVIPAATGVSGADCIPEAGSGWIACGSICCDSWQYCQHAGQCMANPGAGPGGVVIVTNTNTAVQTVTTQFSAPFRVTSGTATTTNSAGGAIQTGDDAEPVEGGTAGGLSPGAIAGIVIGSIAGVALLLAICACCIVRGLWHGVMAILGFGKKDKRTKETIIEEERYTRRGSSHAGRTNHGSWYGGRPSTVSSRKDKKSGAGLLGMGAALGTLALLLGLKKDKKKRAPVKSRSDISSSYYSDVYTNDSPSSLSSDRRTRRSHRHSRQGSRVTRTTTTRVSRAPSARSARSPRRSPPR
ncbi:uncharacterized protein QC761_113530 [Podospora bellae-mahoneyi]|uniref:Mid2 domain-containing protein n=1 Tax=Podospora bellae-mahoneyi TaxID=2093777 RepID=A0ABR0FZE2_9PEZI|nr:hypothetical protein QC761_113530 [Podospora bellae-mahoneyi]